MNAQKTVLVLISGKVQGVHYRAWTREQALKLGLNGWVRNLKNGQVEALFSGSALSVDQMIGICFDGPAAARVDNVSYTPSSEVPEAGFIQRPDV